MCLLQLVAARIAGVSRVVYHVLSAHNEATCLAAANKLHTLLANLNQQPTLAIQPTISDIAARIVAMKYEWFTHTNCTCAARRCSRVESSMRSSCCQPSRVGLCACLRASFRGYGNGT